MGKYRSLGTLFNRVFRNDLNANFDAVDADINAAKSEALANVNAQKTRVDNLITGTPQPSEIVDARGTYPILRDRLNGVDSFLANVTTNTLYIAKYPRLGNETTDDGRFSRLIADLKDSSTVFLEPFKTYTVSSMAQFKFNNLVIFGFYSTIQSNKTDSNPILCFGDDYRSSLLTESITVTKGSNQFILSNVTGINVGDILKITNSTVGVNNYQDGVYGEVIDIDTTNKKVTLHVSAHKSFTANQVYVYTAYRNIHVTGVKMIGSTSYKDICIYLRNVINAKVDYCDINGNYGRMGILFHGINGEILFNRIRSCFDKALTDNITGYGISVSGHNATVRHNAIWNCRHTIAAADRSFYSTGLLYEKNVVSGNFDSSMPSNIGDTYAGQVLDIHANAEGIIRLNSVYNVRGYGICARNDNIVVEKNKIYSSRYSNDGSNLVGIVANENANNNLKINDNQLIGYFQSAIYFSANNSTDLNFIEVKGNLIDWGDIYFSLSSNSFNIRNVFVEKNVVLQEGGIYTANPMLNAIIKENKMIAGNSIWKCCIQINNANCKGVVIKDNDLTQGTAGGDPIRFNNNGNIIKDNKINTLNSLATVPINNSGATTTNIIKDNLWTKSDNTLSVYSV